MKKLLITTIGLIALLNLPLANASPTVIPGPPHDRQFNFEVDAGTKQSATIIVKNLGVAPADYKIYGVDATQSAQGTFALTTQTAEQHHVGQWIKFEESDITVPPGEEMVVPFLIDIPSSATPGAYAGGIAVEDKGKNSSPSSGTGSSVSVSSRFIVKIFLNIPGEKKHQYEWNDFRYSYADENTHARFTFEVSNTGNTILLVEPRVELDGYPSLKQPIIELPTATIQPGTKSQTIDLRLMEKPPVGYYWATGSLTFSELNILQNQKINSVTETRQITINLTPWYYIAIILAIFAALFLTPIIFYYHRINFRKKCGKYTVKEGDTIISIAEANGADWNRIAKVNKIKPPYTLTVNATLLIPPKKK